MAAVYPLATDLNPFQDPLRFERRVAPAILVLFGANGDLTMRKLLPALYRLAYERRLPSNFAVIGNSRTAMSDEDFRQKMYESTKQFLEDSPFDEDLWKEFARGLFYVPGNLNDPALYQALAAKVQEVDTARATGDNLLFYLSTQPSFYIPVIEQLGASGLNKGRHGYRRIVIEKPFGSDLASALELNQFVRTVFPESDVYRIDHYLGKETVQNVFAFRFGNGIFEPLWNRRYVNHVQITAAESIGVGTRGSFYQGVGALRDMIQNHLLQVMATVAMEPSAVFEPDAVRDERAKLLRSIRILTPDEIRAHTVAGQYGPARIGGAAVKGFREEEGVAPDAQADTYAAVTFFVDNWRWAGVPFYLRTGKRMAEGSSAICVRFKSPPQDLLRHTRQGPSQPNWIMLGIQPNDCLKMEMQVKVPGLDLHTRTISLDATYRKESDEDCDAYAGLLLDVMQGDPALFLRIDEVEAAWRVVDPILKVWAMERDFINTYPAGSWGPRGTYRLFDRDDQFWRHSLNLDGADLQAY